MRDRLIELLKNSRHLDVMYGDDRTYGKAADELLANGVIVPPCKVGDRLYRILKKPYSDEAYVSSFTDAVEPFAIVVKNIMGGYSCIPIDDFGKTVFLTREEAEAKLKGEQ